MYNKRQSMRTSQSPCLIIKIEVLLLVALPFFLFAAQNTTDILKEQAKEYRDQGFQYQQLGDLDTALAFYAKAAQIDPQYAVVHNDLGVLYEAKGDLDRAEKNYLKALAIDPGYLSTYTNLALLYEHKRDLEKAAFYWKKRAELGGPEELWTQRAKRRLEDIRFVTSDNPLKYGREQEEMKLIKDVIAKKELLEKDNHAIAMEYFNRAKEFYKKRNYISALRTALTAQNFDPSLEGLDAFIEKSQKMALSE
ncbi:MAG: tetratricopeptide repeat protein [Candidatus Omnitrophica bacterium]|nr:tetratricopeptide repeat protein [Candidatus Omnitrophota bacterium]